MISMKELFEESERLLLIAQELDNCEDIFLIVKSVEDITARLTEAYKDEKYNEKKVLDLVKEFERIHINLEYNLMRVDERSQRRYAMRSAIAVLYGEYNRFIEKLANGNTGNSGLTTEVLVQHKPLSALVQKSRSLIFDYTDEDIIFLDKCRSALSVAKGEMQ